MTAREPAGSQQKPLNDAVILNSLSHVARTRGFETTTWAEEWGDGALIRAKHHEGDADLCAVHLGSGAQQAGFAARARIRSRIERW